MLVAQIEDVAYNMSVRLQQQCVGTRANLRDDFAWHCLQYHDGTVHWEASWLNRNA